MSKLNQLVQHRNAILLAELAGLLHNIGKLDVNFLATAVEGPQGQENIKTQRLDIPNYHFDRFAAPNTDLLAEAVRLDFGNLVNLVLKSDTELEQKLSQHFPSSLIFCPQEKLTKAIWQFYKFAKGNGPLYICQVLRREAELTPIEKELENLERFNIQSVPPSERQQRLSDLNQKRATLNKQLKKTRQIISEDERENQATLEEQFQHLILFVLDKEQPLSQLLTLFWDDFFYKVPDEEDKDSDYQRVSSLAFWIRPDIDTAIPMLLILAHGEMSGSEKVSQQTSNRVRMQSTRWDHLRISTAFGYETELTVRRLHESRKELLDSALSTVTDQKNTKWTAFLQMANRVLNDGLGDTQRPINEITLWDYASSITALFKTSIAKSFLEGSVADANQMHWRLLSVRFDGLDYILQASRIADVVGRQQKYQEALRQICLALSLETPIASQVYQDENGLLFVVPDSDKLQLSDLQALIENRLQQSSFNDLRPHIDWSENRLRGKQLNLGKELKRQAKVKRPSIDPKVVEEWWRNCSTEICEICGLRPAIRKETKFCTTCRDIRHGRVQSWLAYQATTIWLDEVADSNGRLALITGQFSLEQWLDGTLVESLALGMDETTQQPVSKFASFPRIQRIWRTTQQFWQTTQACINKALSDARRRLIIKPADQPDLGQYQVYEMDLLGATRMSVLWDGNHLISTDNLSYTAVQVGIKPEERKTPADAALAVGAWLDDNKQKRFQLISDDEKNRQFNIQIADVDYQDAAYATTIPILAEPRTFMALVPADKALAVIDAIKTKYEREMGKVRNRLPLHLGAVYFHRRTPLRAALDAGRRMLKYEGGRLKDELWTVQQDAQKGPLPAEQKRLQEQEKGQFTQTIPVRLEQGDRSLIWYVPAVMGDGSTPDNWYPYVFIQGDVSSRSCVFKGLRPQRDGTTAECWLIHAAELKAGDQVYFTPTTFDFQWLDSSGRRFEIAYDAAGQRRTHPIRPYLLDDLATIQKVWKTISCANGLTSSQIYALRDLVEAKREEWRPTPEECKRDGMFWRFCNDAVTNANWGQRPPKEKLQALTDWIVSGLFTDVVQLQMGIMKHKPQREEQNHE